MIPILAFFLNVIPSERDAFLLKWNRTVSKRGGAGRNIASLVKERSVRVVKAIVEAHSAILNFNSAKPFSRASDKLNKIAVKIGKETSFTEKSNKHVRKSQQEDVELVVKLLAERCLKSILAGHIQELAQSRRIQF